MFKKVMTFIGGTILGAYVMNNYIYKRTVKAALENEKDDKEKNEEK